MLHIVIISEAFVFLRMMKEAEEAGNEIKKRRAQIAMHYLLIKMYTLEAILLEDSFKFNALTFFKLSMKVLILCFWCRVCSKIKS